MRPQTLTSLQVQALGCKVIGRNKDGLGGLCIAAAADAEVQTDCKLHNHTYQGIVAMKELVQQGGTSSASCYCIHGMHVGT